MALTAHEKKMFILWRLIENDDRLVRQRPSECGTLPDAVWFLLPPQGGARFLGAAKWLERHGYIIESIAPTTGEHDPRHTAPNDLRKYYQSEWKHRIYAASPAGVDWYWNTP